MFCAICHDEVNMVESQLLACTHTFHDTCILLSYTLGNYSCPYCRTSIDESTLRNPEVEIETDNADFIKRYIRAGADIEDIEHNPAFKGLLPFELAVQCSSSEVLTVMFDHLEENSKSLHEVHMNSLVGIALSSSDRKTILLIIDRFTFNLERIPNALVKFSYADVTILQQLIDRGASASSCASISAALKKECPDAVNILIDNGADVNMCEKGLYGEEYCHPVIYAVWGKHYEILLRLLDKGADVDVTWNREGLISTCVEDPEAVKILVEHGASLVLGNPLQKAIDANEPESVELIAEAGARISLRHVQLAVNCGSHRMTKVLIKMCVNPEEMASLLLFETFSGRRELSILELLFESGANVDAVDVKSGRTALTQSIMTYPHVDAINIFYNNGVDVNAVDHRGMNALMHYVSQETDCGETDTVLKHLLLKANINSVDMDGHSALYLACEMGHSGAVRCLLGHSADVHQKDYIGASIINSVAKGLYAGLDSGILSHFVDQKVDINPYGSLVLRSVVRNVPVCDEDIIIRLVENGVNARDSGSFQLVSEAVKKFSPSVVEALITVAGAQVVSGGGTKMLFGEPLVIAIQSDSIEMVTLLLKHGAKASMTHLKCMPIFHSKSLAMIRTLIAHGASLFGSSLNTTFEGAFVHKWIRENGSVFKQLLQSDIQFNSNTKIDGLPLLWYVIRTGDFESVRLLIKRGASVDFVDDEGTSMLIHTLNRVYKHSCTIVELLIEHGACVNYMSYTGSTPLYIACWQGCERCVLSLLRKEATVSTEAMRTKNVMGKLITNGSVKGVKTLLDAGVNTTNIQFDLAPGYARDALLMARLLYNTGRVPLEKLTKSAALYDIISNKRQRELIDLSE